MLKKLSGLFIFGLVAVTFLAQSQADDQQAQALLGQAKSDFALRTPTVKDEAVVNQAVSALDAALKAAKSDSVKYEILVFTTRVLVWQGLHTTQYKPEDVFKLGYEKSDAARNLAGMKDYAEANYFFAVALGRWALEKGPLTVLTRIKEMKGALDATLNGDTVAGDLGEEYDYYGADRVYGRLYLVLPGFAGGDRVKALQHLSTAYKNAPEHTLNALYYAQALEEDDQTPAACQVLKTLLTKSPKALIVDRWQDATEDLADAQSFHDSICKN